MVVANQLFDALTAANVPRDQAHAVVDALEHRMSSELATKADLEREIAGLRAATKADLEREIAGVKIDIAKLDTKMEAPHRKLTIQFGSMMIATAGMLFAALTYTNQ